MLSLVACRWYRRGMFWHGSLDYLLSQDEPNTLKLTLPTAGTPKPHGSDITFDHYRLKAGRPCGPEPSYRGLY